METATAWALEVTDTSARTARCCDQSSARPLEAHLSQCGRVLPRSAPPILRTSESIVIRPVDSCGTLLPECFMNTRVYRQSATAESSEQDVEESASAPRAAAVDCGDAVKHLEARL